MLLVLAVVSAAPLPWGIAVNNNTQECAGYWGGDEYFGYTLPSGWQAYYPGENDLIKTAYGDCVFRKWAGDLPGEEEKCCQALGLLFVAENIGENHGIWQLFYPPTLFWTVCIFLAFVFIFLIIWFVIKKLRKS